MKSFKLNTPVLFVVFNRLNNTKKVFEEIKKAKPSQLFIAADGPRNAEEKNKTNAVRSYILKNIDWECEIKTLFRDKNLGCKYAVSGAVDWFFKNVKQGIILEDDCLPSQSFFRFCQEMLEKYKDDERIMQISGTNVEEVSNIKESYYFAKVFNLWGWATWRRAWKYYDVEMKIWPRFRDEGWMRQSSRNYLDSLQNIFGMNRLYKGALDTWDYQWSLCCIINNGLVIIPNKNQITNIGFSGESTHMIDFDKNKVVKRHQLNFPLKHNFFVMESKKYAKSASRFFYKGRIIKKIVRIFTKKLRGK